MEPQFAQSLVSAALENPKNLASEQELREAINLAIINFQNCDKDKSGALTFSELPSLCESMGLPLGADEDETMANFSKSDSGYLDLEGWVIWWINRVSALPNPLKQQEAIARNTFRKFDKDGSGTLNGRELYDMLLAGKDK
jgi:Ca2+-binding EF-hand superfamily protein